MANDTITLHVHCTRCGESVSLTMGPPTGSTTQTWKCPFCHAANDGEFSGNLMFVAKGHRRSKPSDRD